MISATRHPALNGNNSTYGQLPTCLLVKRIEQENGI